MGRFVVLGAAVAALLQTVVPQDALSSVAGATVVGALALMALAMALSLCSEADAFVAVSFTAFPLGSQLAFLVARARSWTRSLRCSTAPPSAAASSSRCWRSPCRWPLAGALVFDAVIG